MKLLFVDDDQTLLKVLGREIEGFGWQLSSHASGESALAAMEAFAPEVALLDLRMPRMDGLTLMAELHKRQPGLPVVMLTGHGAIPEAVEAMRLGAFDFLTKPAPLDVLEQTLKRAKSHGDLLLENQRLRDYVSNDDGPGSILGESARAQELRKTTQRLALSEENVLILGENGTGKELVARALHDSSLRSERPFVVVNCGAISANLVESELFGHERGSFTGAERKRMGVLEAAHQGTVFLDEIGELPLSTQATLLRALQFGEVRPVGSDSTRHVDLRVIAATNRDLLEEVHQKRFREDLYYRIATLLVEVPALRDRREDIPLLSRVFLDRGQHGASNALALEFDQEALDALCEHSWPGNVRELENAMARLAALVDGPLIRATDVERHVLGQRRAKEGKLPTLDIEQLERIAIVEALALHAGNRRVASAELGIAIKTLYNKILRYGIGEQEFLGS